jgi:ABC-2 type transport system permease protein
MTRLAALLAKELAELGQNPALFLPAILTGAASLVLPFFVAILVPVIAGEPLAESSDFAIALEMYALEPGTRHLDPEAAIQAWIFQQFLLLLVLTPVAGAMSIAAYSVVGEKQARTLEPLLATPITTAELLGAKVLGAFLPAIGLTLAVFAAYAAGVWLLARPGVVMVLFLPRSIGIVFILGPLTALTALQLAVCVSSRVNDARSAQQIGALIILPLAALLVAQLMGTLQLTLTTIGWLAMALAAVNAGLMRLGVRLFHRESILTRWR